MVHRRTPPLLHEQARRSFLVWEEVCGAEASPPVSEHFHLERCHLVCCRSNTELAACLSGLQGWMHAGLASAPAVLVNASVYLCGAESSEAAWLLTPW